MSQERGLSGALFLVALATLMFEVLLTRVFSLTLWYHFAFMAISLAMFGMTLGALLVFLRPHAWPEATLRRSMGRCAVLFAVTMAAVMLLHSVMFVPSPRIALWPIALTFAAAALPFVFSGIFVCLALTRFPARIGQLYAFDLAGAALGCLAVIAALEVLDGVGAVIACATLAALAGALLLRGAEQVLGALVTAALACTAGWAAIHLARHDLALFPVHYVKGTERYEIDYERWNSFSRIAVMKPTPWDVPAWSMSSAFSGSLKIPNRSLQIDAGAGTALIAFDGDLRKLEFLRWDLVNFVHHLRRDARICVVGSGGGRDILAAKVFGQKQIVAVEINADILNVVNGRFGDYTGHLDRDPIVRLVNDEARSYLARSKERFDIVQVTFIDTWAATAAGAYTLTENSLYTVEGWKTFLDRVEDNGLLAVSRGIGPELARLVALGRAALLASGVSRPGAAHGAGHQSPRQARRLVRRDGDAAGAQDAFPAGRARGDASRGGATAFRRGARAGRRPHRAASRARDRPRHGSGAVAATSTTARRPTTNRSFSICTGWRPGPWGASSCSTRSPRFWWWTCSWESRCSPCCALRCPLLSREPPSGAAIFRSSPFSPRSAPASC